MYPAGEGVQLTHAPGRSAWGVSFPPRQFSCCAMPQELDTLSAESLLNDASLMLDPQEGSCDRTPCEPEERKKDQLWQLSAHCPRVFGHHHHLAALV
jgi:hypothetical protein